MEGSYGNPWYLTTLAVAEVLFKAAAQNDLLLTQEWFSSMGCVDCIASVSDNLKQLGDAFVRRVEYHLNGSNCMNEQFDRDTGTPKSVENLSWSYASLMSVYEARENNNEA